MVFGSPSGFPAVFNLSSLNGSNGFSIPGVATGGHLGAVVSSAGMRNAGYSAPPVKTSTGADGSFSAAGAAQARRRAASAGRSFMG